MFDTANLTNAKVLAIDDEPFDLLLLDRHLTRAGFEVTRANSGAHALKILGNSRGNLPEVILLDRMMPGMSGIDFMELFKADADFRDIPVIMQTGLADPEQIAFGIACGARYYLAKPFSGELVVSMVQAAIGDYRRLGELRSVNAEFSHSLALLRGAQFEMRTLEEARLLAHHLSQYFPQPARVITGIVEILVNAVEHGNLGLGYAAKSALLRSGDWTAEISRRLAMPEYRDRRVHVDLERNADRVVLTISDEGDGFDCTPYLEIQPDRVFDLHGRGIAMSRMTSFDKMEYLGRGNQVELTVMCHANGVTAPAQNAASTNAAVPQAA